MQHKMIEVPIKTNQLCRKQHRTDIAIECNKWVSVESNQLDGFCTLGQLG